MKSLDATGFRLLFFLLLASVSLTFRGISIGSSSFHQSLLYGDLPVVAITLFFAFLLALVHGKFPRIENKSVLVPLLALAVWWGVSGGMYAKKGDLFAASIVQMAVSVSAAVFLPGIMARYGLLKDFLDMALKVSIAVAGVAILQVAMDFESLFTSATSTLGPNRSHLGLYMMVVFTIAVYRLMQGEKVLPSIAASLALIVVIIVGSRAAQIGCILILAPMVLTRFSFKNGLRFLVVALVLVGVLSKIGEMREGRHKDAQFQVSENVKIDQSAGRRFLIWIATWDLVTRSPGNFLYGVGFTNYRWEYDRTIKLPFYTNAAHNTFLQVWAESGILGLILFLWLLFAIFKKGLVFKRYALECIMVSGLVLGIAFTGLTQETLYPIEAYCNFNTLFFLAVGVMLHEGRMKVREGGFRKAAPYMPVTPVTPAIPA